MEPNRTRQVIQELARAFNKLASELAADLSYAAREIDTLRKEVQRLRANSGKAGRSNAASKKAPSRTGTGGSSQKKSATSHKTSSHTKRVTTDSQKPAHESSSFVFPQEPFNPTPPPEPSGPGNN